MPSPFPGMNPYLEQEDAWHDFHQRFPHVAGSILNQQLAPNYIVKADETVFIHELAYGERQLLGRAVDVERHAFLEIRDRASRQIITVIELLSPTNKSAGPDRELYLSKRRQILRSPAHLVEIDLLRGWGERMPHVQVPGDNFYAIFVSRAELRPDAEVWPIRLREPLPDLPIPLRAPDADITLPLQQVLHRLYDETGYAKYIYSGQPSPALSPADDAWARSLIP
jgi:hypothetical protein